MFDCVCLLVNGVCWLFVFALSGLDFFVCSALLVFVRFSVC